MTDIERRDELLCAAAAAELGEDAGLGSCTARARLYATAPALFEALQACLPSICQAEYPGSPDYGRAPCGGCGHCKGAAALAKAGVA